VSHGKIRTEKTCLNCGTETQGRFCPACGQQNLEPKQSIWQLIQHFFSDITHFDGKFFVTVKDLFAKPGFLSREYMIGRRASYLDPVRMYIFTSAFFFLIFFSLYDVKHMHFGDKDLKTIQKDPDLKDLIDNVKRKTDSAQKAADSLLKNIPALKISSDSGEIEPGIHTKLEKAAFSTVEAYDSAQKVLPAAERDGWLKRRVSIKRIELNQRYANEKNALFVDMLSNFLHNFPKMLFISLPAFALILKLLYIRRKQFYYVDHGIFAVHLYIFTFLVLLVLFAVNQLQHYTQWSLLGWLIAALVIYPLFYYYKAMRRFYGQGRGKTVLKFILLFMLSSIVQLLIFICFLLFTVFET
jgi:Protein of unknown function (DUF3667)